MIATVFWVSLLSYVAIRLGARGINVVKRTRTEETPELVASAMTEARKRCDDLALVFVDAATLYMEKLFQSEVAASLFSRVTLTNAARDAVLEQARYAGPRRAEAEVRAEANWPHRLRGPSPSRSPSVNLPARRVHDDALLFVQTHLREREGTVGKLGAFVSRAQSTKTYTEPSWPGELQEPIDSYWKCYGVLLDLEQSLEWLVPKDAERSSLRDSTFTNFPYSNQFGGVIGEKRGIEA